MERRQPAVDILLAVDADYRNGARDGTLRKIAPKKFNPEGKAWLPVLRTAAGGWRFTALFSNTARAHELGMTVDWVVIYYDDGTGEQRCTVVTERSGPLAGKRVVRGREKECEKYWGVAR